MAGRAVLRGWNMRRRFAQRRGAVMTGRAAARDPGVIKYGPRKRCGGLVTVFTWGCRRDMIGRFTHNPNVSAAMTSRAARRNPHVVIRRSRPKGRRRLVTVLARSGRREVIRRFADHAGIAAAVTERAAGRDPCVIHRRAWSESRRGFVACVAGLGGRNVRRRLAQGRRSVMTSRTTPCYNAGVVKAITRGKPAHPHLVASVA